jgi:hypothetical protein
VSVEADDLAPLRDRVEQHTVTRPEHGHGIAHQLHVDPPGKRMHIVTFTRAGAIKKEGC